MNNFEDIRLITRAITKQTLLYVSAGLEYKYNDAMIIKYSVYAQFIVGTFIKELLLMRKLTLVMRVWVGGGWHSHPPNIPYQIDDKEARAGKQQEKDNNSNISLLFIRNHKLSKVRGIRD